VVHRPIQIALFAASPVPYQAPLYRRIAADPRFDFTAIFASSAGVRPERLGFSQPVAWDVDALSGYRSIFLRRAERAGIDSASLLRHRDFDVVTTLLRGDFEVLWSHGYNSLTHALAIATQLARRRPLLLREEQTLLHPRPPLKNALRSVALRAIMRRAYALYIGTENRRWFQSFHVSGARQFPVRYCADNDRLQADAKRLAPLRTEVRRAFGIQGDSGPVILTVARLIPKKQPLLLLEAFRRLRERVRCCLLLVGSGELEDELRHEIRERQIPDVILAGFLNQSQIAHAYAAADIFALPSKMHETWGLVVNEAMNFGLPIIVSDKVGCAPDLVHEGENGFVVSADDPNELAERLETLVGSPQLRADFGAASLEIVSRFTYEDAADGILRAVEAAVGPERWAAADASATEEMKLTSRRAR
jgi:glycosyltransferase involved in cell wall biosynthesis